jgi:hypothetical protein
LTLSESGRWLEKSFGWVDKFDQSV